MLDGICETCSEDGLSVVDNDSDDDGVCDADEVGCTDNTACNYDFSATDSDNSLCTYQSTYYYDADGDGLGDPSNSTVSCIQPEDFVSNNDDTCPNDAENDADGDGVCESDEIAGCQDATACNYNENATDDDGSCIYVDGICETCSEDGLSVIDNDSDDDGVCDADEIAGCQDSTACNYNSSATDDDDSCVFATGCETCSGETDGTGTLVDNDSDNDGVCDADEIAGCQDTNACNYNVSATDYLEGSCNYPDEIYLDCNGDCINDIDGDGICDELEVPGCFDENACNYNPDATDIDNSLCDYLGCAGCTNTSACNYNENATIDNGSCQFTIDIYPLLSIDGVSYVDCSGNCLNDSDLDSVCDEIEVIGCQESDADNYNPLATDSGDCIYYGCTDNSAFNYDPIATDDDGSCIPVLLGCTDETALNYDANANTEDNSCYYSPGCTNPAAFNYDEDADFDDGSCIVYGCTDALACNYNDDATDDNGLVYCRWNM